MRVIAATHEHGARLLGLLEENAMLGDIDLIMTRRPDYFSAQQHSCGVERPVIALEGEHAIGMCQLTEHSGFANGQQCQLGYLGSLRVTQNYRHRIRVLQAGFDYLRQLSLSGSSATDYCYTSIAADNHTARRLLERGLHGLPHYQPLGEMHTLVMNRKQGKRRELWRLIPPKEYPQFADFYNRLAVQRQLAPSLNAQWLAAEGLSVLGAYDAQGLHACAVIWDQRRFKQVLAARYSSRVRRLRLLWNSYATLTGKVPLPKMGQPLDQSFLAYFATNLSADNCTDDDSEKIVALVEDALSLCTTQVMTLGLPATLPCMAKLVARTRPMVYRTCLYGVNLTNNPVWDKRTIWPEVALL